MRRQRAAGAKYEDPPPLATNGADKGLIIACQQGEEGCPTAGAGIGGTERSGAALGWG